MRNKIKIKYCTAQRIFYPPPPRKKIMSPFFTCSFLEQILNNRDVISKLKSIVKMKTCLKMRDEKFHFFPTKIINYTFILKQYPSTSN